MVWLLGKTGAGKTAIVAALTGDPRAEVGLGFEPCTRTASFYDVPPEAPLLRFLDTRGLGEASYDPSSDISWCEEQSHLVLVVMQLSDPSQHVVLHALEQARRQHPSWPIVVAQTGLHRLYPRGMGHPLPYPFTGGPEDISQPSLPHPLRQALAHQRALFDGLRGPPPRFVPIDFTLPEDGFPPHDYGLDLLWQVLEEVGPVAFEALHRANTDAESDRTRAKARPLIYGYGAAAAGAGAVPVPLVGLGGLAGVITLMLRTLAARYDVAWTRSAFGHFSGAVGGGALVWWTLRYGLREMLKLIPVAGTIAAGALNAAAGFAVTVAIGEAACVWLAYQRRGLDAPTAEVRRAFAEGLKAGLRQAKSSSAQTGAAPHEIRRTLRRHWPETLLVLAVALPWVSLLVLGMLWLWQTGRVWIWAIVGSGARPPGMAAVAAGAAARERASAPGAGRPVGTVARVDGRGAGRVDGGAGHRQQDRPVLVHRVRAARRQRAPDDRGRVAPLPSRTIRTRGRSSPCPSCCC